ncbi:MAG: porin, partial [Candidatus Gastranaerophilales bacterium]|nr:porin [Candidatus Gastranaerophilales bacterium]
QQGQANPVGNTALGTLGTRYARQTYSSYLKYKYKKFETVSEFASRNGHVSQGRKADGFYTHFTYFVTPKTQLLARYDAFNANKAVSGNHINEYTIGGNYYLRGVNLKLMVDLVYVQDEMYKDSERICIQTQYKF